MTPAQFQKAIGCTAARAALHAQRALLAMTAFGIKSVRARAAFLANMGHESGGLRWTEELWGPTPAQKRYDPPSTLATTLGNTQVGDGHRYRGRGPTQLTGRANYRRMTLDLRKFLPTSVAVPDFEADPDAAAKPEWMWMIAAQFFHSRRCIALADAGNFDGVCLKINGGTNGIDDRRTRHAVALGALS